MIKKLLILSTVMLFYNAPLQGQKLHVALNYRSLEPFIHFQLNLADHRYRRSYRRAYLKGYMDGVNDHYYYDHRFREMVENKRIYEAGYRDGFKDRDRLIRLRGRDWLRRHRFTNDDYYNPSYSVGLWLKNLSLVFSKAPKRRFHRHRRHRVHHREKHRNRGRWRHHHDHDDDDYEWDEDDHEYEYEDDD